MLYHGRSCCSTVRPTFRFVPPTTGAKSLASDGIGRLCMGGAVKPISAVDPA